MPRPVAATKLEFRVLGPLEVLVDGRSLPLAGAQQRALLALLLLHANEPISNDLLVEELWGEDPPRTAPASLRVAVAKLRALLGEEHRDRLETISGGYRLKLEPDELDAWRFEALVTEARTRPPGEARALLDEALALWRAPPLADQPYSGFAQNEVRRLAQLMLAAQEDRIEAELALGHHARTVPELESLVAEHPLRERLRAQLMLALYRSGRQADALEVYREGRNLLNAELGLEPGERLRRLEQEILNQSPAISPRVEEDRQATTGSRGRTRPRLLLALLPILLVAAGVITTVAVWRQSTSASDPAPAPTHSLVRVDPRTNSLTRIPMDWTPAALGLGAHTVWALNRDDQTVARIDQATRRVEQVIGLGVAPTSVGVGAGAVWVLSSQTGAVLRIDPAFGFLRQSHRVAFGSTPSISIGDPAGIAAGAHSVWYEDGLSLSRVDPDTGKVVRRLALGPSLDGVAVGAGSVWAIRGDPAILLRIDPRKSAVAARIPIAQRRGPTEPYPIGVAVGAGAVWVLNGNTGTITRVDPSLDAVVATIDRVSLDATRIAAGAGAVWVSDVERSAVLRIDPATNRVAQTIPVGGIPQALTAGRSGVWVAVDST
jgi:DNA-binding SARP family transcriptional activator/streptogramin lyase